MLSLSIFDRLGLSDVDETKNEMFLKEFTFDVITEYTLGTEDNEVDKLIIMILLAT